MKKLILSVAVVLVSLSSVLAQGTVVFNNRVVGVVDFKVFDTDGVTPLSGTGYSAQLFGGPAGTLEGSLGACTPITTFRTGGAAGYVNGVDAVVPGVVAGGPNATIQMRVWWNNGGSYATWDQAVAAGAPRGASALAVVGPLGGGTFTPPNLASSMGPFSLVPEPSSVALGVLAISSLLFIRRRK